MTKRICKVRIFLEAGTGSDFSGIGPHRASQFGPNNTWISGSGLKYKNHFYAFIGYRAFSWLLEIRARVVSGIGLIYYELFFRPGLSSQVGYPFQIQLFCLSFQTCVSFVLPQGYLFFLAAVTRAPLFLQLVGPGCISIA